MRNIIKTITITVLLSVPVFLFAQNPPHPNGGSGPGSGNTPVGGGAPIGSGFILLVSLATGFGVKKVYVARRLKRNS